MGVEVGKEAADDVGWFGWWGNEEEEEEDRKEDDAQHAEIEEDSSYACDENR